jgi:hypoxia up-regulated 1
LTEIINNLEDVLDKILSSEYAEEITDIEILGGGLRVPAIKKSIEAKVASLGAETLELGAHMNPDEAAAFGAGYIAANFSSSYKVPKVFLYQQVP